MSPERKQFIPTRDIFAEQSRRARQFTTSSWEVVRGMLEKRTHNKTRLHDLFVNNVEDLKEYYETVYSSVVDGREPYRPDLSDNHNKIFATHYRIIRETVTRIPEKYSSGFRKHIRREKASSKK